MKRAVQLTHIRQLCCLGITGRALMPALLRALREFVDADSAGFFWVDAKGEMTNLYADRMLPPELMKLYFERHYDGPEMPFRAQFKKRAAANDPVSAPVATADLLKTAYYNEILRNLDAYHVMYAVIRDQGDALGQLSLYRTRKAPGFSADDRAAIRDVTRYVAHAVSRPEKISTDTHYVDTNDEGLVIVDANGTIRHGSPSSLNLLSMVANRRFNQQSPPLAVGDAAPDSAPRLIQRVMQIARGDMMSTPGASAPREDVDGPWGRFLLSAYPLDEHAGQSMMENALYGVHIRRKQHLVLKLAEAMGALELSSQQREVALLLAQGKTNQEISVALNVTNNTASYHVKQLFLRLDAHDRAEAVSKLMRA